MDCSSCSSKAQYECSCLQNTRYFCSPCLSPHILSSLYLQHNVQEIGFTYTNPLCYECKAKFCEVICLCKRIGICKSCLPGHITISGSHFIDYIRTERQSRDTFDMEKKTVTDIVKQEVYENIKHLDDFKERVNKTKLFLIDAIQKSADELIASAENNKKKMEMALENINKTKTPRDDLWPYNFKRKQSSMTPSRRSMNKEIKLCETELNTDAIMRSIANLGKVTLYGDINPVTQEENIYYFRPKAREMISIEIGSLYVVRKVFPKNLALAEAGSWCEGPGKSLIYCGGCKSTGFTNEVVQIDPINMNFRILPPMKSPRALAAVVFCNNIFYAFGGYSGTNINTCEKFSFSTGKWEDLPNMPVARSAFTIAVIDDLLYMTGDCTRLDIFNTKSDTFECAKVLVQQASYSSLAKTKDGLLLIQNESAFEIDLNSEDVRKVASIPQGKWWSCFPPQTQNGVVVFGRYDDGFLYTFDMNMYVLSKKFKLIA
ncbi:hypothetical protein SteCoe_389 [Stentor coeruleus]|uniref:B box-type domain-containing protein n=1 Tax=Stentor coeruleus TaxID=5963 RepID=A0A1R2D449_9CILI|nr:hypothetical protein SteCoe_389 [Stentor coeruleus]